MIWWFAAYYAIGLLGAYLAWLSWVMEFEDYRCPTPRALVAMAAAGVVAPIPLILAATWWVAYVPDWAYAAVVGLWIVHIMYHQGGRTR